MYQSEVKEGKTVSIVKRLVKQEIRVLELEHSRYEERLQDNERRLVELEASVRAHKQEQTGIRRDGARIRAQIEELTKLLEDMEK